MEKQTRHIELASRIYKEDFKTSWRISRFNLMPFQQDHPVYGPCFMLGKTRTSQWSVLITKELHGGIKNIGFRLVRGEESDIWDMVTFSLGLKFEDGRFLKCIDRQVVGKECNNYNYLVKTIEAEWKEHVKVSDFPAELQREFYDHFKLCQVREQSGISDLLNGKRGPNMIGACGMKGSSTGLESSGVLQESSVVRGSKTIDYSHSEGPSEVKKTTEADIERRNSEIIAMDIENRFMSDVLATLQESANIEKSAEESKTDEHVKNNPTPEELFQQETITVVCEIEYTYMMPDPIPEKETEHWDLDGDLDGDFEHLFTSGKFSDITLKCGNSDLKCHKAVLYTRSLLFKEFLDKTTSSQQPLIINVNFDLPTFKAVLLYVYTNELDEEFGKSEDNCWKMYKAAGLFGVPGLRRFCLEVMEENDDCQVNNLKDSCHKLSVLSVYNSDQKLSVDVLVPVTNTSTQTLLSN